MCPRIMDKIGALGVSCHGQKTVGQLQETKEHQINQNKAKQNFSKSSTAVLLDCIPL